MKIKKFRIWNYKSIDDSGDCYPAEFVTILAGKNEAGKSSILEALEDFNINTNIRSKAKPIEKHRQSESKIEIVFAVTKDDVENILLENNIKTDSIISDVTEFTVTKTPPRKYSIYGNILSSITDNTEVSEGEAFALYGALDIPVIKDLSESIGNTFPVIQKGEHASNLAVIKPWADAMLANTSKISVEDANIIRPAIERFLALLRGLAANDPPLERFKRSFLNYLPNFILFSSFEDIFPNEIKLTELQNNKWILDLAQMSDLDVSVITGGDARIKKSHKTALNLTLNDDFKKYWEQDASKLAIDWDNESLQFWIEENGEFYEPEIRSQGRRWHLAFYIRVSARARENVRNVILIDEPGLYLHANAQRDILKSLEESGKDAPIIFSTHSPYLIEADKLERIRLVQKLDGGGTTIENKLHSVADKETLTPILTAIGLELNRGVVATDKLNNVVVEGPSDYYYLNAFKRLIPEHIGLNFISGGSSGNMPKIGTILQGWGCKVVYLYDSDQAYKDAKNHIKKEWLTISSELLQKLNVDGAIEDILTRQEFCKYVLEGADCDKLIGRNSDYMKGKDKVMKAKAFLEKVIAKQEIALSQPTRDLLTLLFNQLKEKLLLAV